jgi:hypothetical protein
VAGQGFFFAEARPLQKLTDSEFVRRRKELWTTGVATENLSATGRFAALESLRT